MKKILTLLSAISIIIIGCTKPEIEETGKIGTPQPYITQHDSDFHINSSEGTSKSFIIPVSKLSFPSLLIDNLPDDACFMHSQKPDTLRGPDVNKTIDANKESTNAGLTGNLLSSLLKVGLRSSLLDSLSKDLSVEEYGLSLVKVNPSSVEFNFTNGKCENEVKVLLKNPAITGAYLADSITYQSKVSLNQEQTATLNIAFTKLNDDLGLSFSHVVIKNDQKSFSGKSLYFYYESSKIKEVVDYTTFTLKHLTSGNSVNKTYSTDNIKYDFRVAKDNKSDSLIVEFWNDKMNDQTTGKIMVACDGGHNHGFCGGNMAVNFVVTTLDKPEDKYLLKITTQKISL